MKYIETLTGNSNIYSKKDKKALYIKILPQPRKDNGKSTSGIEKARVRPFLAFVEVS